MKSSWLFMLPFFTLQVGLPSVKCSSRAANVSHQCSQVHSITAAEAPIRAARFPVSAAYTLSSVPCTAHLFPCDLSKHEPSHASAHCCSW